MCRAVVALLLLLAMGQSAAAGPGATLRLATGPRDGTYRILGDAIKRAVEARHPHIRVVLLTTAGSPENIRLLQDGKAELAICQNDILGENVALSRARGHESSQPRTILALFQEPVQIVVGPRVQVKTVEALSGRPLALGHRGSGTRLTAIGLLRALGLTYSEIEVRSADEVAEVLQATGVRVDAGFFVANTPTPQVAALLADPSFQLLPFTTAEMATLRRSCPYYEPTDIPAHTYPNQPNPVCTISVLNVLVCRADLPEGVAEPVTRALLEDAFLPTSGLRRVQSRISASGILALTRPGRAAAQVHRGAESALHTVPITWRLRLYLDFIQWGGLAALALTVFLVSVSRRGRLRLLQLLAGRGPAFLVKGMRRVLLRRLAWVVIGTGAFIVLIWVLGAWVMYWLEKDVNVYFRNLGTSAVSILVYLFSGLEDRAPVSSIGWIGTVFLLGMGLLASAYVTGRLASELILHASGVFRMDRNSARDTIVVIGWNPRAERVVRELLSAWDQGELKCSITVVSATDISAQDRGRFESGNVTFVSADPTNKQALAHIGAHKARSIIILADRDEPDADAQTALVVLTVRRLMAEEGVPDEERPRICVEVMNHRRMGAIRDAGADELICHEDFGLGALAQAALTPSLSQVYQDLLDEPGSEIHMLTSPAGHGRADIPDEIWEVLFEGKTFEEAADVFVHHRNHDNPAILIGVRRGDAVTLNPREPFRLRKGDELVVLSYRPGSTGYLRSALKGAARTDGA
jgi:TRAP transporter TAXI family solute receptor